MYLKIKYDKRKEISNMFIINKLVALPGVILDSPRQKSCGSSPAKTSPSGQTILALPSSESLVPYKTCDWNSYNSSPENIVIKYINERMD